MHCPVPVKNVRRVLCVFPAYAPSFGTFAHAYKLMPDVRAFMPPQGLLVIAAYLPASWEVRFIDENIAPATAGTSPGRTSCWSAACMCRRRRSTISHAAPRPPARLTVLGGPSVSGAPEMYPEFDYLHIGEIGDATDELIASLDDSMRAAARAGRFETEERLPLADFPDARPMTVALDRYLIGSLQFSSGCPYRCEFCDIPALYGRQPRLKTPEQILRRARRHDGAAGASAVDLFRRRQFHRQPEGGARAAAASDRTGRSSAAIRCSFACEATLNIAKQTEILALMREAAFHHGLRRHRDAGARRAASSMRKEQNASLPILEAIDTLNCLRPGGDVRHHPRA